MADTEADARPLAPIEIVERINAEWQMPRQWRQQSEADMWELACDLRDEDLIDAERLAILMDEADIVLARFSERMFQVIKGEMPVKDGNIADFAALPKNTKVCPIWIVPHQYGVLIAMLEHREMRFTDPPDYQALLIDCLSKNPKVREEALLTTLVLVRGSNDMCDLEEGHVKAVATRLRAPIQRRNATGKKALSKVK
jgi:hypothetical protein